MIKEDIYGLSGGFSGGSVGKESSCSAGDTGYMCSISDLERSFVERHSNPVFLPGEFHRQRSLAAYSPWGCKELDMTERLSLE